MSHQYRSFFTYADRKAALARRNTDELIAALCKSPLSTSRLHVEMMRCGESTDYKYAAYCGHVGCAACRKRYVGKQANAALKRFDGLANSDFAFVTIIFGMTCTTEEIGPIFAGGKRKVRNAVDIERRRSAGWTSLEFLGWMEVDAFDTEHLSLLPPDRRAALEEIGLPFSGEIVWVVTIHAIVKLGGAHIHDLERALKAAWPSRGQADVRPFQSAKPVEANIWSIISYANKHECRTDFWDKLEQRWEPRWRAEFYRYIDGWSRKFEKLRMSIGPKGERERKAKAQSSSSVVLNEMNDLPDDVEPMPFLFDNNSPISKVTLYRLGAQFDRTREREAWVSDKRELCGERRYIHAPAIRPPD